MHWVADLGNPQLVVRQLPLLKFALFLEVYLFLFQYDLKLYESTNRASRTVVQPKTERTLTSSKMVKPKKKKSPVEKIQNLQATKKEDPTAELVILPTLSLKILYTFLSCP